MTEQNQPPFSTEGQQEQTLENLSEQTVKRTPRASQTPQLARGMTPSKQPLHSERTNSVLDTIKQQWGDFLKQSGHNVSDTSNRMQQFLNEIAPDIDKALAEGSEVQLRFIDDRMRGALGRVSLGLVYRYRDVARNIVLSTVRTVLMMMAT